ncbi:MAG TPA: BTAD domain-containing putative transcriptional regulator, partial [Acidimicrobiia bacterium]|nr:BTAD domain-containing putative transcriptional regulator [Acidimicrobiia bacterium]
MRRPLDVKVLGTLEVTVDGSSRDLGGPKQQTVLAVLIVFANQIVSRDRLIDEVWPSAPPPTARKTLQRYLSHLRALLDDPDRIEWLHGGYRLVLDADELDQARFERLADHARTTTVPLLVVESSESALSEWRGAAFSGLVDSPVLLAEATRLEERRLAVLESFIDARLALGHHTDLVSELRALVGQYPMREVFWSQLMMALYRSGRQAEALRFYQRAARLLRDDLGLDPSPDLQQLELRILRHDPTLSMDIEAVSRPLPSLVSTFVGRGRELAEVADLVRRRRLVTIVGPPGVGKTRLAIELGRHVEGEYPDDIWLADLAPVTNPDMVTTAVSTALGLTRLGRLSGPADLGQRLRTRHLLLIMDNCEHLAEASARVAEALVQGAANVVVIATSRIPLHADGETAYNLDPLPVVEAEAVEASELLATDATRLFVERAGSARATFDLSEEEPGLVAEICRRLDGLPLAIELAASQVRVRTLTDMANDLASAPHILDFGQSQGDPRHRTMSAAVESSYELLPDATRIMFRWLSVFTGSFDGDAAQAVAVAAGFAPADVGIHLSRLVDSSLLGAERSSRTTRFRMLEVVRQYAESQLYASGEDTLARKAHALHYASRAVRTAMGLRTR